MVLAYDLSTFALILHSPLNQQGFLLVISLYSFISYNNICSKFAASCSIQRYNAHDDYGSLT